MHTLFCAIALPNYTHAHIYLCYTQAACSVRRAQIARWVEAMTKED